MHKTKKKSTKTDKIPKPIKVKKEKTEEDRTLHTMSHYIDDRLELIKQIFGTLKPKTITNLAPEFLKKKSLDEIEEACLNELLCISTKRLRSIIDASKCPTDTESSEDSDVEHKEEHISLEEISSDSEIYGNDDHRVKNKKKKIKKSSTNKDANKSNVKTEPESQISVLELLELQARARAIRSQLALEPVTKIEVESEEEIEAAKSNEKGIEKPGKPPKSSDDSAQKRKAEKERKLKSNDREHSNLNVNTATEFNGLETKFNKDQEGPKKKIKLKRSYRTFVREDDESLVKRPEVEANDTVKLESKKSRSASPDVIPIQAETETLLITDSSDDENKKKDEPKEKSSQKETAIQVEHNSKVVNNVEKRRRTSELEDGEVSDKETEEQNVNEDKNDIAAIKENKSRVVETNNDSKEKPQAAESINEVVVKSTEVIKEESKSYESNTLENSSSHQNSDDDNNDDVISIEGGDLETEMNEQLANEDANIQATKSISQQRNDLDDDDDIISLDTSDDERSKSQNSNAESWQTRYLKSSKVNQVLAASRLGKRVRDKIKKSKRSKKEEHNREKEEVEQKARQQTYSSQHEDGSVEQYKELVELSQRKS